MIDETIDEIDPRDLPSALAVSEGLTFRYEVLIASLRSRIFGALYILIILICAAFGSVIVYFIPSESKFSAAAWPFIPSLLVIFTFSIAATVRYILSLKSASYEAHVALDLQLKAQSRVSGLWSDGDSK
ncbi:hypothetical protein [Burkholderia gladioli]|uniref:hypothetical protein n=1 Tax=Burkholderia gladioli TaxID=28095 RepID=UPI0016403765|nr:hypothetical protein [Burkholderia gladioli]